MARAFYKAVNGIGFVVKGAGYGLKETYKFAVGARMLEKRGLKPAYEDIAGATALGVLGGGFLGVIIGGVGFESLTVASSIFGVAATLPSVAHLPYALYKAGKHDENLRLSAPVVQKQLPAPKPKPGPLQLT